MTTPSNSGLSAAAARRFLWIAALLLVPMPMLIFADAFVPTARYVELALVIVVTILVEGTGGTALLLLAVFAAHAAVYAAALWLGCWALTAVVARFLPRALGGMTVGLIACATILAFATPLYRTPFHARIPHSTLLEVYE